MNRSLWHRPGEDCLFLLLLCITVSAANGINPACPTLSTTAPLFGYLRLRGGAENAVGGIKGFMEKSCYPLHGEGDTQAGEMVSSATALDHTLCSRLRH